MGRRSLFEMQFYLIPGVISIFSVVIIWLSLQLDLSPAMIVGDSMQPRAFPIFLMVINLVLAGLLAVQYWKSPPKPVAWGEHHTWSTIALFIVFYFVTVHVDLFIAIFLVMFVMCYLWGERRVFVAGTVALVTPITMFFLFDLVLKVRFPRGLLTNWYYG